MELLGEILHFSKSGRLIVKIDNYDSIYEIWVKIYLDDQGKKIGKISEFIGPVTSPYASFFPLFKRKIN